MRENLWRLGNEKELWFRGESQDHKIRYYVLSFTDHGNLMLCDRLMIFST